MFWLPIFFLWNSYTYQGVIHYGSLDMCTGSRWKIRSIVICSLSLIVIWYGASFWTYFALIVLLFASEVTSLASTNFLEDGARLWLRHILSYQLETTTKTFSLSRAEASLQVKPENNKTWYWNIITQVGFFQHTFFVQSLFAGFIVVWRRSNAIWHRRHVITTPVNRLWIVCYRRIWARRSFIASVASLITHFFP